MRSRIKCVIKCATHHYSVSLAIKGIIIKCVKYVKCVGWCVRASKEGIPCVDDNTPVSFIRDELKSRGLRVSDFSRWVTDLSEKGLIAVSTNGFITLP